MMDPHGDAGLLLARAAERLVGTRYRLHGRDPATGLDCIGLLSAALAGIGRRHVLPTGYTLRTREATALEETARACGFAPAASPARPGDVAFLRVAPCQFHLAIAGDRQTFIHAHAGLRRVVAAPSLGDWLVVSTWRLHSK